MFNDTDGGGFFNADNSFGGGSPQVSKKGGEQKRAQNIMPVTAKQVLTSGEDGLRIGDLNFYLVTLVGIVRAVEATSVKVTYVLEDNTGCIEGVNWIDGEDGGQAAQPQAVENTYCRLSGTIRTQGDKRYIMVFNIQQIEDFNEVTTHFLEVALFSKKAEARSAGGVRDADVGNTMSNGGGNNLTNSLMVSGGNSVANGLTECQKKVLTIIQGVIVDNGISSEEVVDRLRGQAPKSEVMAAMEFLCSEGHIYSTIDDNHYRSTEHS